MPDYEYQTIAQPHSFAGNTDDLSDDDFAVGLLSPIAKSVVGVGDFLADFKGGGWEILSHSLIVIESKFVMSFFMRRATKTSQSLKDSQKRSRLHFKYILPIRAMRVNPKAFAGLENEQFAAQFVKGTKQFVDGVPNVFKQVFKEGCGEIVSTCYTRVDNRLVISALIRE